MDKQDKVCQDIADKVFTKKLMFVGWILLVGILFCSALALLNSFT